MTQSINGTAGNDLIQPHADSDYLAGELVFVLGGMPSQGGWPLVNVLINGQVVMPNVSITSDVKAGVTQAVVVPLPAGASVASVGLQFTNDLVTKVDDRNVYVGSVTLNGTPIDLASGTYVMTDNPTTSGQHEMNWNGTMTWSGAPVQAAMSRPTHVDNVSVDGAGGQDVAVYQGRASGYSVGFTGSGFTVAPKNGAWSADTLNLQNVLFDDKGAYGTGGASAINPAGATIDAGTGLDTLYLRGTHSQYLVSHTNSGFSITGPGVQEWATNVERLGFSDGFIGLDIDGTGGYAYRVYQAAFDRKPDAGGLGFWINAMDNGSSMEWVAANFAASTEFQTKYGTLDNHGFAAQLYNNVLHRSPDAGGIAFWEGVLNSGEHTRAWVLAGFAQSPENQANVVGAIQNGFYFDHSGW